LHLCINIWAVITVVAGLCCLLVWSDYKENQAKEISEVVEEEDGNEYECICDCDE
jgi:hypothetical protein